ncbi:hypothetical protein [Brevundimonas denitrificans]|uniref:hypothetical protein n=1 Tax=Brevundimonas denitrificans TaxID=1443434 RepID=UPI0024E13BC4|nr:hypothetical protein [Brevundimonas denitrificans]
MQSSVMERSPAMFGRPLTMRQKRQLLKDRYHLMVGPMLLVLGVSLATSEPSSMVLAWVAGTFIFGLTVNRIVP